LNLISAPLHRAVLNLVREQRIAIPKVYAPLALVNTPNYNETVNVDGIVYSGSKNFETVSVYDMAEVNKRVAVARFYADAAPDQINFGPWHIKCAARVQTGYEDLSTLFSTKKVEILADIPKGEPVAMVSAKDWKEMKDKLAATEKAMAILNETVTKLQVRQRPCTDTRDSIVKCIRDYASRLEGKCGTAAQVTNLRYVANCLVEGGAP
jgi:hypothetical protein